jgi:lambda repressor-like predicted transcriptional regulator
MPRPKKHAATNDSAESGKMNKAEMVRQIAKSIGKTVRPRDIVAAMKEKGVTVSYTQVSKALQSSSFRRRGRRRRVAAANGAATAGSPTKAERIRQVAKSFGKKFRPRDIIAELAKEGTVVSSAQVSATLRDAGYRRRRRGRRGAVTSAASPAASGLNIEALVAAKALIAKVGGIANAEAAISALKKLQ